MDAAKVDNKKIQAKAKLAVDGIAHDIAGLKRQVCVVSAHMRAHTHTPAFMY